jgi:hypothetical protein
MPNRAGKLILKANGEREPFYPEKLFKSLVHSGAEESLADKITSDIASSITEGDKTKDIYKRAFTHLRQEKRPMAARYSVKHALLELGPSGYPFEDFLAEIYKELGYISKTRVIVQGRCIEHELDVVAVRGNERIAAEIKFHNNSGVKSDIKVALYVHARFEDIAAQSGAGSDTDYTDRLLITNTKFTKQVEVYAACVGLQILSWDYPAKGNLRELIEQTGVHPVSCLTTLSKMNKRRLMEQGIVLCRQLRNNLDKVENLGVSGIGMKKLVEEIEGLC